MDSTFGDMIAEGWLIIYMDDVLVYAETLEECQEQTKRVLERMKEEDLHLKLAKCTFNCYAACIIKYPSSAHSGVVRGHVEFLVLWM